MGGGHYFRGEAISVKTVLAIHLAEVPGAKTLEPHSIGGLTAPPNPKLGCCTYCQICCPLDSRLVTPLQSRLDVLICPRLRLPFYVPYIIVLCRLHKTESTSHNYRHIYVIGNCANIYGLIYSNMFTINCSTCTINSGSGWIQNQIHIHSIKNS